MKLNKNKKILFLIILISLIVVIAVIVYIIIKSNKSPKIITETISLNSLGTSALSVEIPENVEINQEYSFVYIVKEGFLNEQIEKLIKDLNLDLELAEYFDTNYMEWEDGENKFGYDSITNVLTFELAEPIFLGEKKEAFKTIFLKYFDESYDFTISKIDKINNDLTNYYAKRVLEDTPLERGFGYEYTDILRLDGNGYVRGGSLLLTEFEKKEGVLPIVTAEELIEYINLDLYPKESYVYASHIMDTIGLSYLDPRWEEIHNSASNCKSGKIELIYLYKSVNQGYLYPIFKILANCDVEFETEVYTVPAVFYVNAIQPDYVTVQ